MMAKDVGNNVLCYNASTKQQKLIHRVKTRSQPTHQQVWESKIGNFLPTSRQQHMNLQFLQQRHNPDSAQRIQLPKGTSFASLFQFLARYW